MARRARRGVVWVSHKRPFDGVSIRQIRCPLAPSTPAQGSHRSGTRKKGERPVPPAPGSALPAVDPAEIS